MKKLILLIAVMLSLASCDIKNPGASRYDYDDIINLNFNPQNSRYHTGLFSDQGSWMGFSVPEKGSAVNGFRGPFSIYMRYFAAEAAVNVECGCDEELVVDSVNYMPGELYMRSTGGIVKLHQNLNFITKNSALLRLKCNARRLRLSALRPDSLITFSRLGNDVLLSHKWGERVLLSFEDDSKVGMLDGNYEVTTNSGTAFAVISFITEEDDVEEVASSARRILGFPATYVKENTARWNNYLKAVIRDDMPEKYDRVAAKAVTTLTSNWRSPRGGIKHDGIVPSHAVGYFIGCWAWDCWRFSAAMAGFNPELAKNNIRVMFDYQQPDGMIIDCIYPNPAENNYRDSKPPLVAWSVKRVYDATGDKDFVRECWPKLMKFYKWWYENRDHDHNGFCEFGSVDGTLEAAAWESGMDNAIRFDGARMLQNGTHAWSVDQESVDLNYYLANEYSALEYLSGVIGQSFDMPDLRARMNDYFYDEEIGYFCDRRLDGQRSFVEEPGCEGYIPFWTGIATREQFARTRQLFEDETKFSTYIPFPTIAADNPKYDSNGYWRGPIWLDQTYYGIRSFRNYGDSEAADRYTDQVFTRLDGLLTDSPIFENYDTFSGRGLQASHFSWSAAYLLMMYEDYGRDDFVR